MTTELLQWNWKFTDNTERVESRGETLTGGKSKDAHCTSNRAKEEVNYAFCHIPYIYPPVVSSV